MTHYIKFLVLLLVLASCEVSKKAADRHRVIEELNILNKDLEKIISQNDSLLAIELGKLPVGVAEAEKKKIQNDFRGYKQEFENISRKIDQIKKAILEKNTESQAYEDASKIRTQGTNLKNSLEKLKSIKVGVKELTETVSFEHGRYTLKESGKTDLMSFAEKVKNLIGKNTANKVVSLTVHGYTDNTGKPTTNQELSENRASSVSTFLGSEFKNRNIAFSKKSEGFGEKCPPNQQCNEADETKNPKRRICLIYALISQL